MTHPEARAESGFAAARPNDSRTSLHARGHSMSGDRDAEAADRAAARPPTSPPADHGRKAAPGSDTANPTAGRPPTPTRSRTATPMDPPPECRAPSRSEERDGESESTSLQLYLCRNISQPVRFGLSTGARLGTPPGQGSRLTTAAKRRHHPPGHHTPERPAAAGLPMIPVTCRVGVSRRAQPRCLAPAQ